MSFTLTSNTGGGNASGGVLSLGTALTTGDLMIVGLVNTTGNNETISSISDTVGTTYHYSGNLFSYNGNTYGILWGFLGGTGANSLSITWSAGSTSRGVYAEFTGSSVSGATQDGSLQGQGVGSTTTSVTVPSITTTGADDLVVNYIDENNGTASFAAPWSTAIATGFQGALGYQADVAANTYSPNATIPSGGCGSLCLALKSVSNPIPNRPNVVMRTAVNRSLYY